MESILSLHFSFALQRRRSKLESETGMKLLELVHETDY